MVDMTAGRDEDAAYKDLRVLHEMLREILQDIQREVGTLTELLETLKGLPDQSRPDKKVRFEDESQSITQPDQKVDQQSSTQTDQKVDQKYPVEEVKQEGHDFDMIDV